MAKPIGSMSITPHLPYHPNPRTGSSILSIDLLVLHLGGGGDGMIMRPTSTLHAHIPGVANLFHAEG